MTYFKMNLKPKNLERILLSPHFLVPIEWKIDMNRAKVKYIR